MSQYFADNYTKLCTIEVNLSRAHVLTQPKATGKGSFCTIEIGIILLFGMTELRAQVAWKENVSGFICCPIQQISDLFYAWFLGNRETVSFKRNCFLVELL